MGIFTLFKESLLTTIHSLKAIDLKFWHRVQFLMLLSVILSIPIFRITGNEITYLKDNGSAIIERVPNFIIKNNQLHSELSNPFVVNTNYITFIFDPKDQIIGQNLNLITPDAPIKIQMQQRNLEMTMLRQNLTFSYADMTQSLKEPFSRDSFIKILRQMTTPGIGIIVFLIFLVILANALYLAFLATIIATFLALYRFCRQGRLNFHQRFNLALAGITEPLVLICLINLFFNGFIPFQSTFILTFSLFNIWLLTRHAQILKLNQENIDQIIKNLPQSLRKRLKLDKDDKKPKDKDQ